MWPGEVEEAVPDGQQLIVPLGSQGMRRASDQTNVRGGQALCVDKHGKQGSGQLGEMGLSGMCCVFSGAPKGHKRKKKTLRQKGWVLSVVKHVGPGGEQTRVQIPGPLFPSSVTWPYPFISLRLGFIIREMGMVRLP